ncbi:MAG: hypothetical protein U0527_12500 [Candidatus Eisenbacteria bacterium]
MRSLFGIGAALLVVTASGAAWLNHERHERHESREAREQLDASGEREEDEEFAEPGPEGERLYFDDWHGTYGATLPPQVMSDTWKEIESVPSEPPPGAGLAVNSWQSIGPYGMQHRSAPNTKYSGRILDIESVVFSFRVAAASGGIWRTENGVPWYPISDGLNTLAVSAMATRPGSWEIYAGTGEALIRTGTGLWRSTDQGATWVHVNLAGYDPGVIYRLVFSPDNANQLHCATDVGYFRSDDGGYTWTRRLAGNVTDIAVDVAGQFTVRYIWATLWGSGLWQSWNGGNSWSQVIVPGLPTANVGRGAVALRPNSSELWVSYERNNDDKLLGVYRSIDGAQSFWSVSPPEDYMKGQGWYDNVVTVHPSNGNIAFVGGVDLWRTLDGGANWNKVADVNVHPDHHRFLWIGSILYDASDGGLAWTNDNGTNWSTDANALPITQYVNFDIGTINPDVIVGGSQDNGLSVTFGAGYSWYFTANGDGGGISIDPGSSDRVWATSGFYTDTDAWHMHRSTDAGWSWFDYGSGIDASGQWYTKVRTDRTPPVWLYTESDTYVYRSTNDGLNWTKMNTVAFPLPVGDVTVSRYSGGYSVVYACLDRPYSDQPIVGAVLRVYDGTSWTERSTGLSTEVEVRTVEPHPQDTNVAYAVMKGFTAAAKVYRTSNRGISWINISGNLPNVPMGDLVVHPSDSNRLWVGTEFGCYRTIDGGAHWERWNNGMPEATIVTEMGSIDRTAVDGTFWVVAATYGRGIWKREVSGTDPVSEVADAHPLRALDELRVLGNPIRDIARVRFRLGAPSEVDLRVYDVVGREVLSFPRERRTAGEQEFTLRRGQLAAGTYCARG